MKRGFVVFILTQVLLISGYCQSKNEILIKVFNGKYDERGVLRGYKNLQGDTVIPIGKYFYCFTDTLKNFAIVQKLNGQLIGIDKNDTELFEIYCFDNGPDDISDGLFRIIKNKKIGYADTIGKIIIEPQYDCAFPFEKGKAKVSNDCRSEKDGEHSKWISDNWIYIDKKGQIIK